MLSEKTNISQETVLGIVAAKICGGGLAYNIGKDGVVKIIAGRTGVFVCEDERVYKFNRYSNYVTLNTIGPYSNVAASDIVAFLELTKKHFTQQEVDDIIFALTGNVSLLSVTKLEVKTAAILHTDSEYSEEHLTKSVKRLLSDFPTVSFDREYSCPHNRKDIANTLENAARLNEELLFIVKGVEEKDEITAAIKDIADEIICDHVPEVYLSDLIIGLKDGKRGIVIPYNYGELTGQTVNQYIQKVIVNDKVSSFDFASTQTVILPQAQKLTEDEMNNLVSSSVNSENDKNSSIAAIILAAGTGSRSGRNKLLYDVDGKPLFLKAVETAIRSKANPVFVVTGYQHESIEKSLEHLDVNIIYNSNYRAGIKTSINLGLSSIPTACQGAILIPADMPNLNEKFINKMIDAFDVNKPKQVVVAGLNKVKQNPVVWSKSLFDVADVVPENANIRPTLVEHSDYTTMINTTKDIYLLDVNFPNDFSKISI